jgi:hypothetical protein
MNSDKDVSRLNNIDLRNGAPADETTIQASHASEVSQTQPIKNRNN